MRRRDFIIGSVAIGASLSANSFAQAPATVRLALSWINNVEYAGVWIALERGFFTEEKLQVQHLPGGPNAPPPLVTLAADKADLGYAAWLPFLDAVGRGNDFVLIAATFPVSPLGIISRADKPILKATDIVGKKILAQGPNERTTIDATLALNKLPKEWEFIPAGFSPEPLLSKQGDGYTAFETNQVVALERMNLVREKDFHFVSFDSLGYKSYASVLFTTRKYLTSNRPTVIAFCKALTRGWTENAKDPSVAAKLAVTKYGADLGLDLKQQTRQNELQLGLTKNPAKPGQPLLILDRDTMVGPMFDAARASGRTNLPDPDKLADFKVMEEVHATLKKT